MEEEATDISVKLSMTMHADDVVSLQTIAYGLDGPVIVIRPDIDDQCDLVLTINLETWGVGTAKDDVLQLANLLDVIKDALETKGEQAYDQATEVSDG